MCPIACNAEEGGREEEQVRKGYEKILNLGSRADGCNVKLV
jgi:hypothetical protein